jgi:threonine/homoserine/homoserine lactone efflux protein
MEFGITVIAVSASGVLAPGPLFIANLLYGAKFGTGSGIRMAYGHTIVELALIIILAIGLLTLDAVRKNAVILGLSGGIAILCFAALQIWSIMRKKHASGSISILGTKSAFPAGIILTALNPFFLIWWFTVGLKLIVDSTIFGFVSGLSLLFMFHIWMDYVWLAGTAYLASKGVSVLKSKYYPLILASLATVLIYYGITFLWQALSGIPGT